MTEVPKGIRRSRVGTHRSGSGKNCLTIRRVLWYKAAPFLVLVNHSHLDFLSLLFGWVRFARRWGT